MIKYVIKRNGEKEKFDKNKIKQAIISAAKAVHYENSQKILEVTDEVVSFLDILCNENNPPDVEQIQDLVEKVLMEKGMSSVAKEYVLYRNKQQQLRNTEKLFNDGIRAVENYLSKLDWEVNENSNMGYSLPGLNNFVQSKVVGEYWMQKVYSDEIAEAHKNGAFHIHDLSSLSTYCCGWNLEDLLLQGFGGISIKIESEPPKHLRTALGQIFNFFYTLQGESAGAQALSNFDTYLAPFIAYDNLNYRQVKQHMQEFLFNMNVPTRVGWQSPFTNITMDLECPKHMEDEPAIIGGERMKYSYGEFQREIDIINKAFAEIMLEGDKKGKVFSFPIPTYNLTPDFNWNNEVLNPVWEMTAKYGIPYFANFVNSDMKPDDVRSMCCRLRIDNEELRKRGGGLFGANPMTGSIGVVTLNMPRIGHLSSNTQDFIERTKELMDLAKQSLITKRKVIENLAEKGLYPYSTHYLQSVKDRFGKYFANHFNTIGLNGMNEAIFNFMGVDIGSEIGRDFAIKIMKEMRQTLKDYQKETEQLFNLEATPAESTCYRLAKKDLEKFGKDIKFANHDRVKKLDAEPYYTNSTQLPVGYTDDIFEAFELQDELQTLYTGGTVLHGFLGERVGSIEATKKLVRRLAENFELPYYSITPTFSICPVHGYLAGEHEYCPKCDAERED